MNEHIDQVQAYLDRQPLLRFEEQHKTATLPLLLKVPAHGGDMATVDLLSWFFDKQASFNTIEAENGRLQCSRHRNRSIGDIYRILKFYVPTLSLRNVYDGLEQLRDARKIVSIICRDIHKRVWYKHGICQFYYYPMDEFKLEYKPGELASDYQTLLRFININE